jgi:hypothetical protein
MKLHAELYWKLTAQPPRVYSRILALSSSACFFAGRAGQGGAAALYPCLQTYNLDLYSTILHYIPT